MDIPDAFVNIAIGLVGGVAGGVITGIYTLKATDKAIREQNDKELRRDEKEVQNLLDALGVEINALWSFHQRRVGNRVEELPSGQPLEFYYPLTQDYFTIYNSNAALIGRIKDAGLREAIVVCYNKCKKVVDGFKYNNELVREYRDLATMPQGRAGLPTPERSHTPLSASYGTGSGFAQAGDPQRIASKFKELVDYAHIIKEDHFELKGYVEGLLGLLNSRN